MGSALSDSHSDSGVTLQSVAGAGPVIRSRQRSSDGWSSTLLNDPPLLGRISEMLRERVRIVPVGSPERDGGRSTRRFTRLHAHGRDPGMLASLRLVWIDRAGRATSDPGK